MTDSSSTITGTQPASGDSSSIVIPAFKNFQYSTGGGLYVAMIAFMDQIKTVQDYDVGLMSTSAALQESAEKQSNYWINLMSGVGTSGVSGDLPEVPQYNPPTTAPAGFYSDQQIINWISTFGSTKNGEQSTEMQAATATLNTHNTLYNQASSYWSGLNNTTNQNSSDAVQTVQTDLQEYSQGPQALLTLLAQVF